MASGEEEDKMTTWFRGPGMSASPPKHGLLAPAPKPRLSLWERVHKSARGLEPVSRHFRPAPDGASVPAEDRGRLASATGKREQNPASLPCLHPQSQC